MSASSTPFTSIEAAINREVGRALANAEARLDGGEPFAVIFDRELVNPLGLVEASSPAASFDLAMAPGLRRGSRLYIAGSRFEVCGGLEPDISGWVTVQLREA